MKREIFVDEPGKQTVTDYGRELLNEICNILTVAGAGHEKIADAINRENFSDLEDCLQVRCAGRYLRCRCG